MHFLYIDRGELVRVFQVKERHCTIATDRRGIYMQKKWNKCDQGDDRLIVRPEVFISFGCRRRQSLCRLFPPLKGEVLSPQSQNQGTSSA